MLKQVNTAAMHKPSLKLDNSTSMPANPMNSSILDPEFDCRVFHVAILPLVAFYTLFATVLYPAAAYLHPHGMYESLAAHVPVGLHGLLKVIRTDLVVEK